MSASPEKAGLTPVIDRRVRRTRSLLHHALFELIGRKDYDQISVSEILQQANIGRSTFYMHFRDKDELFAAGIQQKLESMRTANPASTDPVEAVLSFGRAVFEHIDSDRAAGGERMGHRGRAILHERVRKELTRWIQDEMRRPPRGRSRAAGNIPTDLLAQHVAATFVLVLEWWVDRESGTTPAEADAMFRALVLPALATARLPGPARR